MRLIDADFLKEWVDEYLSVFKKYDKGTIKGFVDHAPTIEPKRGEWIVDEDGNCRCSVCGVREEQFVYGLGEYWYGRGESNYCPNCGSKNAR